MSDKRLALQWVNDMPIIDGARLFDTLVEASAFIDEQPDSECWTVPRIDYCNSTEDALRNELADRLAYECARQIVAGRIGTRSGIGDTLLRYLKIGQPGECDSVPEWMRKYEDLTTPQDGA